MGVDRPTTKYRGGYRSRTLRYVIKGLRSTPIFCILTIKKEEETIQTINTVQEERQKKLLVVVLQKRSVTLLWSVKEGRVRKVRV